MADRVPATITIGGRIAAALIPALVETIQLEELSAEWDGEPFDGRELPVDEPLQLYAQEVTNGEFDDLEAFCRTNNLSFRRWSGGSSGSFTPEIVVWPGQGECRRYSANDSEQAVITAEDANELGSYDAVLGYLAEAAYAVPALQIER